MTYSNIIKRASPIFIAKTARDRISLQGKLKGFSLELFLRIFIVFAMDGVVILVQLAKASH